MSFKNRIRRAFVALKEEPKTVTKNVAHSNTLSYFEKDPTRDKEQILRNQKIYHMGGVVSAAVDTIVGYTFMDCDDGFEFTSKNDTCKQAISDFVDGFDFFSACEMQATNSLVAGDGLAEIRFLRGGYPVDVVCRDPYYFDAVYDDSGNFTGYKQLAKNTLRTGKTIDPKIMWHVKLIQIPGSIFGKALLTTAFDDIIRDAKTAEGVARGVERHGTPKYDVVVSTENGNIADEDLDKIAGNFKGMNAKHEFIHRDELSINMLDTAPIKAEEYNTSSLDRLCAALRVPQELVGLGRGSTEATANVRMEAFEKYIKSLRAKFNYQTNTQLFSKVLAAKGLPVVPVYINFGDIIAEDFKNKSEAIRNLMPAADPFYLFYRNEFREMCGYGSYEDSDLKDVYEEETPNAPENTKQPPY